MRRLAAGLVLSLLLAADVAAQRAVPFPVPLDTALGFQHTVARVGTLTIAGQPTEAAFRALRAQGVTTVINLRTPPEMANRRAVPFDEEALLKELGMRYVHIPVRGDSLWPYAPATVAAFADAYEQADGRVLLHCTVAWRASHLWAAYLVTRRDVPLAEALRHAGAMNLGVRPGNGRRMPLEDFLNQDIPALHPPAAPAGG